MISDRRLGRSDLRPVHIQEKKRKNRTRMMLIVALLVAILIGGVIFVFSRQGLRIQSIQVEGVKVIDAEDVSSFAREHLSGEFAYVVPKNSIFFYKETHLLDALRSEFPRAEYVGISLEGRTMMNITMRERGGRYLWCGDTSSSDPSVCYFVDAKGFIFSEAPYFSDNVYLKIYGVLPNTDIGPIGTTVLPESVFVPVMKLREALYDKGIKARALVIKEGGEYEFILMHADGATVPKMYFNNKNDLASVANNLISAVTSEPLKTDFRKRYDTLEYLDARYDNKVFFKFRGEE